MYLDNHCKVNTENFPILFKTAEYLILRKHHHSSRESPPDGHSGCSQSFAITKSAVINNFQLMTFLTCRDRHFKKKCFLILWGQDAQTLWETCVSDAPLTPGQGTKPPAAVGVGCQWLDASSSSRAPPYSDYPAARPSSGDSPRGMKLLLILRASHAPGRPAGSRWSWTRWSCLLSWFYSLPCPVFLSLFTLR